MLRNVLSAVLFCATALIISCSGGGTAHEISKQGDEFCRIVSDVTKAGSPCMIRCRAEADPGAIEIESWSWGVSNGRIADSNEDGSVVWISIDEPGVCTLVARGVDKDGRDCTTPRHKLHCARGLNSPPVVLCDGPTDHPFDKTGSDGTAARYHEWRWNVVCYDPDDPNFDSSNDLEISRLGDLNRDGIPDVVVAMHSSGDVMIAPDLDGDGVDDDCDGIVERQHPLVCRHRLSCPSKSKEDVYVWKVRASSGVGKKEFKGHVTLMK